MRNNRVLDFASYHKLNEAEESGALSAVDQIIDLFFQAYAAIVTKIGQYPEYQLQACPPFPLIQGK